jgi:ABC-type antimicrobial peptide transport system permease subunit
VSVQGDLRWTALLVVTGGSRLAVIGVGVLAGWAIAVSGVIVFYGGRAINVGIFVGVPALLMVVAAVSCWLSASRAARCDPMAALRQQ